MSIYIYYILEHVSFNLFILTSCSNLRGVLDDINACIDFVSCSVHILVMEREVHFF